MARAARPYLLLAGLWAGYFHPLLLAPGRVLYSDYSDFLAEHLPAKLFLAREWRRAGELPLWNPDHFAGSPFVADVQVGCFYPPYAVTYLVPESAVGAALSWVVALHVLAAGAFTYLYARSGGLGEVGGLTAAAGVLLSAKWMTHLLLAGHTVTVGLAWLPLVLLGLERAATSGRAWPAVGAGVALALLVLGTHPQWAFYAGVFAAAWTLGPAPVARQFRRWLAAGGIAVAVAVALAAVQLAPTAEAAGLSARSGGVGATGSLAVGYRTYLGLIGPALTYRPPWPWEARGVFGACWLAAAVAAAPVAGGPARWRVGVLLGLVLFAVGGAALVEWLPGFNSFRVPGRMLLIAAFPLAVLAGTTTDALARSGWAALARAPVRKYLALVTVLAVLPAAVAAWPAELRTAWLPGVVGWAGQLFALAAGAWLVRPGEVARPRVRTAAWVAVLLAEQVAPAALFPAVRPLGAIYPRSAAVGFLADRARPGGWRVLDWYTDTAPGGTTVLGTGASLALVYELESVRGYNPLDVRHYRDYLGFVAGEAGPQPANGPYTQQVIPDLPVVHPRLLDLLGVKYLAAPADSPPDPDRWRKVFDDPAPFAVPPLPTPPPDRLPPYAVYENPSALPRAFVVPEAAAMPPGGELAALTGTDLTRRVLLATGDPLPPPAGGAFRPAEVVEYRPNRVAVRLPAGGGGFLVLADVWYPGWVCRVDGERMPVYRADHAFRAVAVPAGAREAEFAFEPRPYRVGWWVSAATLGALAVAGLGRLLGAGRRLQSARRFLSLSPSQTTPVNPPGASSR